MQKRKLIEVALPLEAINRAAGAEKARKVGKPQQIHHWWARRPITAARALLLAQILDDPSSRPIEFPTEEGQKLERDRLHQLVARVAEWDSLADEKLLRQANNEMRKATGGNLPSILDPFAGGGTIPLEAQRLGLEVHASDLNPVAVLINKALTEIPAKYRNQPPVFPGVAAARITPWEYSQGLAADVRAYGEWMRDEAERRIGHLYPQATLSDGTKAAVIAWIWARTVVCPNPACGIEMPLVRSWWLSKKAGKEAYVVPSVIHDPNHASGKRVNFTIHHDKSKAPVSKNDGTMSGRTGAICIACQSSVQVSYLRSEFKARRGRATLMAIVADGGRKRVYLPPNAEHRDAASVPSPSCSIDGEIADNPRWFSPPVYGLDKFSELFTNRQIKAMMTFSDLIGDVREKVLKDSLVAGMSEGTRLDLGGSGASGYADSVATYLGLVVSRLADWSSNLCRWEANAQVSQQVFGQQSVNMTWDFSESRTTGEKSAGSFGACLNTILRSIEQLQGRVASHVIQADATVRSSAGLVIHTDPPYYDNVGYSDLSDFFYVWQRRSLSEIHPSLFGTLLVPKQEELVANSHRHGGKEGARHFFEQGFQEVFSRARKSAAADFPIVVWYAFKQSESSVEGRTYSGWETLLDGMIRGGWEIKSTWPIRSEGPARLVAQGTNALASSIVLALRPRPENAPVTDRRGFIAALHAELPQALRNLQHGAIAPVDLPQAAIGPGMAVFSRYARVLEADGTPMTVRSALARINEILDQVLNEQEGDFDATTRFSIAWYRQHGYGTGQFGAADGLARARNTAVEAMDREGVLISRAGKVTLLKPSDFASDYDVLADHSISAWETMHHLVRVLESEGISRAGEFLASATSRPDSAVDADMVKELAFLLFAVAEKSGWTQDALSFNTLATSWPEILEASRSATVPGSEQGIFDFDGSV